MKDLKSRTQGKCELKSFLKSTAPERAVRTEMRKASLTKIVAELQGGIAYDNDGLPDVSIEIRDYDISEETPDPRMVSGKTAMTTLIGSTRHEHGNDQGKSKNCRYRASWRDCLREGRFA